MASDTSSRDSGRHPVNLLIGHDDAVLEYLRTRLPDFDWQPPAATALGSVRAGQIIGGCAYYNFRPGRLGNGVEMACAGEPGWLNRRTLFGYFFYPFVTLGCVRVTAIVSKKNKRARSIDERLGFRLEGVHPFGMEDGTTAMSYGMIKRDCRWIDHG